MVQRNVSADENAPTRMRHVQTSSDVQSLTKSNVMTPTNKANTNPPSTILLIGESGAGKSSLLVLIANFLAGNDVDHYKFTIVEHYAIAQGGPNNESRTHSARLYELRSKNGEVVSPGVFVNVLRLCNPLPKLRIIDTPGLTDTRGRQHDGLDAESITAQIREHIDSITAVLVVANGTIPGVSVGTTDALSSLSVLLPNIPANKIALVLTNLPNRLYQNFSDSISTLPDVLRDAPQFLLSNPVALQKRYLGLLGDPNTESRRAGMRRMVKASEQAALEVLVELFDWLGVERPPTIETISLGEKARNVVDRVIDFLAQRMEPLRKFGETMREGIKRTFIG